MGYGEAFIKYILFFVNLVCALAGLVLLGLGAYVQIQSSPMLTIAHMTFAVPPISTMVVGGLVFVMAFFGCCGAIRESNCMLVMYSIFMILLMIANVIIATLIFVKMDVLVSQVGTGLEKAFQLNAKGFQEIEIAFHCCGPRGATSYRNPYTLPDSCCEPREPNCEMYTAYPGCKTVVSYFLRANGIIAFGIASFQLVAAVLALCLANRVRNKDGISRYS